MGADGAPSCSINPPAALAAPPEQAAVRSPRYAKLEKLFGIDLRSLALFRVALGVMILLDLIDRFDDITAHYTDAGVLPRWAYLRVFPGLTSLHLANGSGSFQEMLFVIAGVAALALIIGFHTRAATLVSWAMLISLQNRNPMVLQAGDSLFVLLLFWSLFLPLGARWSVDSALNTRPRREHDGYFSVATFALLMQVCMVYWFGAMLKMHPIWLHGQAVWYAMHIDSLVSPFGVWLRQFETLLGPLTYMTLAWEGLGPFVAFIPWRTSFFRCLAIIGFMSMHLGFTLAMELGLFSYIAMVGWLVFLPPWFWDALVFPRLRTPARLGLKIYFDGDCGFCRRMVLLIRTFLLLPHTPLQPAQDDPRIDALMREHNSWVVIDHQGREHFGFEALVCVLRHSPIAWPAAAVLNVGPVRRQGERVYAWVAHHRAEASRAIAWLRPAPLALRPTRVGEIIVAAFFIGVVLVNIRTVQPKLNLLPKAADRVLSTLRLSQRWNMFAPYPKNTDGWIVVIAKLPDGSLVDLFTVKPLTWEQPALVSALYGGQNWRKYVGRLTENDYAAVREPYVTYLARLWNESHPPNQRATPREMWYIRSRTIEQGLAEPKRVLLWPLPPPPARAKRPATTRPASSQPAH